MYALQHNLMPEPFRSNLVHVSQIDDDKERIKAIDNEMEKAKQAFPQLFWKEWKGDKGHWEQEPEYKALTKKWEEARREREARVRAIQELLQGASHA